MDVLEKLDSLGSPCPFLVETGFSFPGDYAKDSSEADPPQDDILSSTTASPHYFSKNN